MASVRAAFSAESLAETSAAGWTLSSVASICPFFTRSPSLTYKWVILANALEPMFTCTLGLISPEAVTTDVMSSRTTFPVCTVTTPLALLDGEADDGQQDHDAAGDERDFLPVLHHRLSIGKPLLGTHLFSATWYEMRRAKVPLESKNVHVSGVPSQQGSGVKARVRCSRFRNSPDKRL